MADLDTIDELDARETDDRSNGMSELELLAHFAGLHGEKAEAETELNRIKGRIASLEETIADIMTRNGIQNHNAHGRTLYLNRDLQVSKAKDVETAALVSALQENTMGDFVTHSPQRLKSFVKEADGDEGGVPEWLAPLINVQEVFSVRSRKSSSGSRKS